MVDTIWAGATTASGELVAAMIGPGPSCSPPAGSAARQATTAVPSGATSSDGWLASPRPREDVVGAQPPPAAPQDRHAQPGADVGGGRAQRRGPDDVGAAERPDRDGLVAAAAQAQRRGEARARPLRHALRRPAPDDLHAAPVVPRHDRVAEAPDRELRAGVVEVLGAAELDGPAERPAVGPEGGHDRQVAPGLRPDRRDVAGLVDADPRAAHEPAGARDRLRAPEAAVGQADAHADLAREAASACGPDHAPGRHDPGEGLRAMAVAGAADVRGAGAGDDLHRCRPRGAGGRRANCAERREGEDGGKRRAWGSRALKRGAGNEGALP